MSTHQLRTLITAALVSLALCAGCNVTPINLPQSDGASAGMDSGSAAQADKGTAKKDGLMFPDGSATGPDAAAADAGVTDGLTDGITDGITEGGITEGGISEGGPGEAGVADSGSPTGG